MITPYLIWTGVAVAMLVIILVRLVRAVQRYTHDRRPVIELSREREEFWIPGDRPLPGFKPSDKERMSNDYELDDYGEFEDL